MTLGFLICLPNLIWQIKHGLISLHFLQHIHKRDVGEGRMDGFWRDQFLICTNLMAAPLWIAGLIGFLRDRRYRMLVACDWTGDRSWIHDQVHHAWPEFWKEYQAFG